MSTVGQRNSKPIELNQEDKCEIQRDLLKEDKFIRDPIQSTRMRMVCHDGIGGGKGPIDLAKFGFEKTNAQ